MNTPLIVVADEASLARLVDALASQPVVGVDSESNSLHAYRERVCLIQLSASNADYIVDPIALPDLSPLGALFANPAQQKIFHAAEGDLSSLRRDFRFTFANIFDTMVAARSLGWPRVGLADILGALFGVAMNKQFQRADWKRRPLSAAQLEYARLDTHYLTALRDRQLDALIAGGRLAEVQEEFERLARPPREPEAREAKAQGFWRVKGVRDLTPAQAAVLEALHDYRERQAERADSPPFKVMEESTLLELVRLAPRDVDQLRSVRGMTPDQIRRHASGVLQAIEAGLQAPPRHPPQETPEPDDVRDRYDRLHLWRKTRARQRGVESDVILPRTVLRDLAARPPRTLDDLAQVPDFGPWRRQTYGPEILALLSSPAPSSGRR